MVQHLPSLPEDLGLISSTTKSPARRTDCGTIVILPRSWNYILPPLGTASYNHVPGAVTLDKYLQVEICTTGTLTNAALVCDGGQLTKLYIWEPRYATDWESVSYRENVLGGLRPKQTLILTSTLTAQGWKSHTALLVRPLFCCLVASGSEYSATLRSSCQMLCPLHGDRPGSPMST